MGRILLLIVSFLLLSGSILFAQASPHKEFIRIGGRPIAIEGMGNGLPWDAAVLQVTPPSEPPLVGASFSASIQMSNTGTQVWQSTITNPSGGVHLKMIDPANPGVGVWGTSAIAMTPGILAPGSSTTFMLNGTAPSLPGTYPFEWRMERLGAGEFGASAATSGGVLEVRTQNPDILQLAPLGSNPITEATFTARYSGGPSAVRLFGVMFLSHANNYNRCLVEFDLAAQLVRVRHLMAGTFTSAPLDSTGTLSHDLCYVVMEQSSYSVQGNTVLASMRIGFNTPMLTGWWHNAYAGIRTYAMAEAIWPYKGAIFTANPSGAVTIAPSAPNSLAPWGTVSFAATTTGGTTNNVRWTVLGNTAASSSGGTFTTSPTTCAANSTYRAPSTVTTAGNVTIQAESCDNASWKNTALVPITVGSSVTISGITPAVTSVTGSQQFAATVSNADVTTVQWDVSPSGAHTVSPNGLYTANGYTGNATVTARSAENPNIVASPRTFTVQNPVNFTLTSSSASQSTVQNTFINYPIVYSSVGTTGTVTFSLLNLPAGTTAHVNPSSVINTSTQNITATLNLGTVTPGTYSMIFRGVGAGLTRDLPLTLVVLDCGTITLNPQTLSVFPYQMANFTAVRTGTAANHSVSWEKNTPIGQFFSALDPPAVTHPQISYYASTPSLQPATVIITARSSAPGCSALTGSATVTKANYVPNSLSLLFTNPLGIDVHLNQDRYYDYGAASANGSGEIQFIQLEARNNMGEIWDPATTCAVNFTHYVANNDPNGVTTAAWANVSTSAAAGGSTNIQIPPRDSWTSFLTGIMPTCELHGNGSSYHRSGNLLSLHIKVHLKSPSFPAGTIHVYTRTYGTNIDTPAIRQYMGTFTTTN